MPKEQILYTQPLEFSWPCCSSCDGWRCDEQRRILHATIEVVQGEWGIILRIVGEDAEEIRKELWL